VLVLSGRTSHRDVDTSPRAPSGSNSNCDVTSDARALSKPSISGKHPQSDKIWTPMYLSVKKIICCGLRLPSYRGNRNAGALSYCTSRANRLIRHGPISRLPNQLEGTGKDTTTNWQPIRGHPRRHISYWFRFEYFHWLEQDNSKNDLRYRTCIDVKPSVI